jgi:hypothetical protein
LKLQNEQRTETHNGHQIVDEEDGTREDAAQIVQNLPAAVFGQRNLTFARENQKNTNKQTNKPCFKVLDSLHKRNNTKRSYLNRASTEVMKIAGMTMMHKNKYENILRTTDISV